MCPCQGLSLILLIHELPSEQPQAYWYKNEFEETEKYWYEDEFAIWDNYWSDNEIENVNACLCEFEYLLDYLPKCLPDFLQKDKPKVMPKTHVK